MPLRRNRRQYEQLTDFDRGRIIGLREAGWSNTRIGRHLGRSDMVVARCWQQWITECKCTVAEGQDVPGTQMIARIVQSEEWPLRHHHVASIDSTPLTSFQTSSAIKRNHKETTDRSWLEEPTSAKTLPLTPHHRQCRLDFCRPRATWSVTDWRRVIFSDESRFSLSADDHRTRLRRTGQRSDPAFIVERYTAISQGVTVGEQFLGTHDHL
ncbi:HTH_38 domain-containing protein [Trichonephila clavipes]|nr:HTH_38 domain-containing protein [Trichonephila clavipes]